MLRQALFTNARAIRSAAVATRTSSVLRTQAQLAARPALASLPVRTTRWYTAEANKEGEKKEGEEAKAEEKEVEDPLKKKLEAKEKEVIDLKVRKILSRHTHTSLMKRRANLVVLTG